MALQSLSVLGMRLDATSYQDAVERVCEWAMRGESRTVAVANVHSVMEAHDAASFRDAINTSDLATPDGVPLVWLLKASGISSASRVYGPDLTVELLRAAERETSARRLLRWNSEGSGRSVGDRGRTVPGGAGSVRLCSPFPRARRRRGRTRHRRHPNVGCPHSLCRTGLSEARTLDDGSSRSNSGSDVRRGGCLRLSERYETAGA